MAKASSSLLPVKVEQIHRRLTLLAKDYPQAEIARRLGLSRSTVNAYFKGSKVPASFLSALVDEFKLNPAWLLCGEGTPWLADVSQGASRMAGDLLEVVKAMQSVAKMRLGALLGRDHLKALRELNTQFAEYEALRSRLSLAAEPVLRQIVSRLAASEGKQHPKAMTDTIAAGAQISGFVADDELVIEFDRLRAWHLHTTHQFVESLSLMRSVLFRAVVSGRPLDGRFAERAHYYVFLLASRWRLREARSLTRAVLNLLEGQGMASTGLQDLQLKAATLDVELGDLEAGMRAIRKHLLATKGEFLSVSHRWSIHWAMLCAGLVDIDDSIALCDGTLSWANMAMRLIGFIDHGPLVDRLQVVLGKLSDQARPEYLELLRKRLARWRRAHQRRDSTAADEAFEEAGSESKTDPELNTARRFARGSEATRLARAAGDLKAARHYLREAESARQLTAPEIDHGRHLLAEHFRNAIELAAGGERGVGAELQRAAEQFFEDHGERGYVIFSGIRRGTSLPVRIPRPRA